MRFDLVKSPLRTLATHFLVVVVFVSIHDQTHANLLRNPSFEAIPAPQSGQGILPSDWLQLAPDPGADTYSNDGSYGVHPSALGNFTDVTAFDGIRWVAGWSLIPEMFGQMLTEPLLPGFQYSLSAWLHQAKRADLAHPGSYEIGLAADTDLSSLTVLGQFALTTNAGTWEERDLTFSAPANAADLPLLVFRPIGTPTGTAYTGLDQVFLSVSAIPEVSRLGLLSIGLCLYPWLLHRRRQIGANRAVA